MIKRSFLFLTVLSLVFLGTGCRRRHVSKKPVLYLYPETEQEISVKILTDGEISFSYPKLPENTNTWNVIATPNSLLTEKKTGKQFNYLFWESLEIFDDNITNGYVVSGDSIVPFFENILPQWGLSRAEYNDFIVYWAPLMQENKYNLIHFAQQEYTEKVKLEITPKPESLLRLFMIYKPLEEKINIPEQPIVGFVRKGFTAVEWGGTNLTELNN